MLNHGVHITVPPVWRMVVFGEAFLPQKFEKQTQNEQSRTDTKIATQNGMHHTLRMVEVVPASPLPAEELPFHHLHPHSVV